jgi:phospholipase/carboxylesterase
MSEALLETVEAGAREDARASVIWLHGLGADGYDFQPIVPELRLAADAGVRFVFPHAPVRPVTLNGGMSMRAWYDLYGLGEGFPQDVEGLRQSAGRVRALVQREIERGVDARRIVLAGFSQGGAVALYAGLRHPEPLAGIMGLSTYLPDHLSLADERSDANAATPIFLAHGSRDPVLPFDLGDRTRGLLEDAGYPVEWHAYAMEHQVCLEEIGDIAAWLTRVLEL